MPSMGLDFRRYRGRRTLAAAGSVLALGGAVAGLAVIVYTAGGLGSAAGSEGPDPGPTARAYVRAWTAGDYRAMYRKLAPRSRSTTSFGAFRFQLRRAERVGSVRRIRALRPV